MDLNRFTAAEVGAVEGPPQRVRKIIEVQQDPRAEKRAVSERHYRPPDAENTRLLPIETRRELAGNANAVLHNAVRCAESISHCLSP